MDLSKLDLSQSQAATLHLRHPASGEDLYTDEGDPMTITVLGKDSPEYRNGVARAANARMKNTRKQTTVEAMQSETISLMASITVGWSGIQVEGEVLKFNTENAKDLYRRFSWIREQVDEFVDDRANFLASA